MDSSKYPATNLGIFYEKVPEIFYFGYFFVFLFVFIGKEYTNQNKSTAKSSFDSHFFS